MTTRWVLFLLLVAVPRPATPQESVRPDREAEVSRLDEAAADPDRKMFVLEVIARKLNTHRNRLLLLRRRTGESYGQVFASQLAAAGKSRDEILGELRAVNRLIDRTPSGGADGGSPPPRPVVYLGTAVGHNSAGTYFTFAPEVGIDTRRISLVVGAPYYRISGTQLSAGGVGDLYVSGLVRGRAGPWDLGANLVLGLPTGDESKGLGAGKVTIDASGLIERRFERMRPFLRAGVANYIFNNVGYQRPYIATGNAAHISGGVDVSAHKRLVLGAGGFAVLPWGSQNVHSRMTGGGAGAPGLEMTGIGHAGVPMDVDAPFYARAQQSIVPAEESRDHGIAGWGSITLRPGIAVNISAARSFPFDLTTLSLGLGFDVGRIFFPGKHF